MAQQRNTEGRKLCVGLTNIFLTSIKNNCFCNIQLKKDFFFFFLRTSLSNQMAGILTHGSKIKRFDEGHIGHLEKRGQFVSCCKFSFEPKQVSQLILISTFSALFFFLRNRNWQPVSFQVFATQRVISIKKKTQLHTWQKRRPLLVFFGQYYLRRN